MLRTAKGRLLLALFIGVLVAANYPVLRLVDGAGTAGGVPWVPLYLFLVWALTILAAALILERRRP
ncbi:MAG: hypothetical protein U1E14_12140 [Geminicoccaceae bacterium]